MEGGIDCPATRNAKQLRMMKRIPGVDSRRYWKAYGKREIRPSKPADVGRFERPNNSSNALSRQKRTRTGYVSQDTQLKLIHCRDLPATGMRFVEKMKCGRSSFGWVSGSSKFSLRMRRDIPELHSNYYVLWWGLSTYWGQSPRCIAEVVHVILFHLISRTDGVSKLRLSTRGDPSHHQSF